MRANDQEGTNKWNCGIEMCHIFNLSQESFGVVRALREMDGGKSQDLIEAGMNSGNTRFKRTDEFGLYDTI